MVNKLMCGKCKKKSEYVIEDIYYKCKSCNAKNKIIKCKDHIHTENVYDGFYQSMIKTDKDFSIQEWLGFNYLTYIEEINNYISGYDFKELKALSTEDLRMGKLSDIKIERLKRTLRNGINNNRSINEIAKSIERNVKPGAVYRIDKEGKRVPRLNQAFRSNAIARTEVTRVSIGGALKHYKDAGVKRVKWLASYSERTCPVCETLNNTIYEIGHEPMWPAHAMCRCALVAMEERR